MDSEMLGILVPLSAIVLGIGYAIVSVLTLHRRRSQALEQRHRERMAAIERGIELPPDANDPEAQLELARSLRRPRFLLRGFIYTGVGIALIASWSGPGDNVIRSIGFVALAVGVAQLLYYVIEGRKETGTAAPPG